MSYLSADELLTQATCAVLIEGQTVGTAWLVDYQGHLLTAGHVLCQNLESCSDIYDEVHVQFADDKPCLARKVEWAFQNEINLDFALLKLTEMPLNRQPLPVSLARSWSGRFRLYGYGESLAVLTAGVGMFVGLYGFESSRLFRLSSRELPDEGFSGGAVYSEELGAVVAIQSRAGRSKLGPTSETVLAMPLYRIADKLPLQREPPVEQEIESQATSFWYHGPLPPDSALFRGRQRELKQVKRLCRGEVRSYLIIFSGRQTGKTSLFYRISHLLRPQHLVCQINLEAFRAAEPEKVYGYIANRLGRVVKLATPSAPRLDSVQLSQFVLQVATQIRQDKLVLLFDELGNLPQGTKEALGSLLRSWFTDRFMPGNHAFRQVMVVLAGGIELYDLAAVQVSPLFNVCKKLYLPSLTESDAIGLISDVLTSQGISADFANQLGKSVFDLVCGHPYLTQRIGGAIEEWYERDGESHHFDHHSTSNPKTRQVNSPSNAQEKTRLEVGHERLSFKQRAKLVKHLLLIPSIADSARRAAVIDELPDKIKTNVAYNSVAKTHIFNILNTCLQYSNGMQELTDILQFFEDDSIPMQQFTQSLNHLLPNEIDFSQNDDQLQTDDSLPDIAKLAYDALINEALMQHLRHALEKSQLWDAIPVLLSGKIKFSRFDEEMALLELLGLAVEQDGRWTVRNALFARILTEWYRERQSQRKRQS